jgi:hypothetical protein
VVASLVFDLLTEPILNIDSITASALRVGRAAAGESAVDEYLVVLVNAGQFDRLMRKDDLFEEGVAAIFTLPSAKVELVAYVSAKGGSLWNEQRDGSPSEGSSRWPIGPSSGRFVEGE